MNQDQNDETTMLESVNELLLIPANKTKIDLIPDLKAGQIELGDFIQEINDNRDIQTADTKGVARNKEDIIIQTIEDTIALSGALVNLGRKTSNNELIQQFNFSQSSLEGLRSSDLISKANTTAIAAQANKTALSAGGVTQIMIDALAQDVLDLTAINGLPEGTIKSKKVATDNLIAAFPKTRELMEQTLIPLMRTNYKVADNDFFSQFMVRTAIISTGSRKLSMFGSVFNLATSDKLSASILTLKQGATIILENITTGPKGNYRIPKELASGTYEMTVTRPGYTPKTFTGIIIISGERLRMDFGLTVI